MKAENDRGPRDRPADSEKIVEEKIKNEKNRKWRNVLCMLPNTHVSIKSSTIITVQDETWDEKIDLINYQVNFFSGEQSKK